MHGRFLVMPVMVGASLLSVGCATKSFVRAEVEKSATRLSQDVARVDGDLSQEKARTTTLAGQLTETRSVADGATRRADEANTQAGNALAKAGEAGGLANEAMTRSGATDSRLTRLWNDRNKYQPGDTVTLTFGFDRWVLDDRGETTLLDVVKQLQENPNLLVQLEGYTDKMGTTSYNLQLSQKRVEAVRRFLAAKGIGLHRIQSIGLGDARPVADNNSKQGREQNRRVAVILLAPTN